MENKVTKEKIDKYRAISKAAFLDARKNINKSQEKEAEEILEMVACYLEDSEHFEKQENLVNTFACLNYAHGWLDCGARLGIFKVKDRRLFTVDGN